MVTSINKEALWMHTVNHLTRNKMDQKKKNPQFSNHSQKSQEHADSTLETTTVLPCRHNERQ